MGHQASKHAANEPAVQCSVARRISFSIIRRNRRKGGRKEKRMECALCGGRKEGGREGAS